VLHAGFYASPVTDEETYRDRMAMLSEGESVSRATGYRILERHQSAPATATSGGQ
jgi:hypothetical protein